jgi:hypothetical protein
MLFSAACCLRNSSLCLPSNPLADWLVGENEFFFAGSLRLFVSRSAAQLEFPPLCRALFVFIMAAEGSFVGTQKLLSSDFRVLQL